MKILTISNKIHHLGEGPMWNSITKQFYWLDILHGEIWTFNPLISRAEILWKGDHQVGGFAFTHKNDIVFCSDKGVFYLETGSKKLHKIMDAPFGKHERFNDITTGPEGRIYAGTKDEKMQNSKLFLLEQGKKPQLLLDGLGISNGMTFSPDEQYFYHTDSPPCTITRYNYKRSTGEISCPEVIYQGHETAGYPDGLTIDADGNLWAAFWGASCLRQLSPEGNTLREIKLPAIQVSSLIFGGENMNELLITSACEGGSDLEKGLDKTGDFLGGKVFHVQTESTGRKEWPAKFDIENTIS